MKPNHATLIALYQRTLARGRHYDETPAAWEARRCEVEEAIAALRARQVQA